MLAARHVHAERVLALLEAAANEAARQRWTLQTDVSLGMELVLQSPVSPPSDATNYLGGVGDVLENKSRRGDLSHLGPLATTAPYDNDRMLHEVHYTWRPDDEVGYHLHIWTR